MLKGRPSLLNKSAQKFLDLYLDPLMTVEQICNLCGIGKSTFYNHEKELNLPKLRVGVGSVAANLPRTNALAAFSVPDEVKELNIVRRISREIQARIKIIPVLSTDAYSADDLISSKNVDFVISSLSKTKKRAETLYFSENYNFDMPPMGVLIRNPAYLGLRPFTKKKPTLGVLTASVHAEYADANLQAEFYVKHFRAADHAFLALQNGNLDFVLFHPAWFQQLPHETFGLEICSKPYWYDTHSAIVFHADSTAWIQPVNSAIENLYTEFYASGKK